MLLRNSISITKKFIRKSIDNLKSLLSNRSMYERLPKHHVFHPFSCSRGDTKIEIETAYKELDNYYSEFRQNCQKNCQKMTESDPAETVTMKKKKREFNDVCSKSVRERRVYLVAEKLKEIMDEENVEPKKDVEEVLYYYSRLTCSAYLDIVDKFFMEMCVEFLGSSKVSNNGC